MKIDLHCHSKYSKRPSLWLMQKLGCPESFTEPLELYHMARRCGMTAVTITDHNVIDGALEIADLPGAFLGCEYTTYFPKDRCKVHVLAYGFTEAQHRDMTEARENIFELVDYFHQYNIPNVCAHPLFWVNDRLNVEHIEQLALLFKNWEVNGDIAPGMNEAVRTIATGLTPDDIERLIVKHNIVPRFPEPWVKNITGGSDDHSSLNLASTYTHVPGATSLAGFWEGVRHGQARIRSGEATPAMFARNVYGIAYQFYKSRFDLERYVHKDVFLRFADRCLQTRHEAVEPWFGRFHLFLATRRSARRAKPDGASLLALARDEAERLIRREPDLSALMRDGDGRIADMDATWFDFVQKVSNKLLDHFVRTMLDRLANAKLFDLFHSVGSAGALYALLAPYFVAFSLYMRQRQFGEEVVTQLLGKARAGTGSAKPRLAHFTDTYHEVNGVARTLQQQLASSREMGVDYSIVTCLSESRFERGVHHFKPVGQYNLPEYPELKLYVPPFLAMLNHCYEERVTHLHLATPGPVGLAGLGIARILGLPVSGTYHTAFPQYAKALTDDGYMEDMSWRYMVWFYNQLDMVFVPSRATGDELVERGIDEEKIRVYPRGIDVERFRPDRRKEGYVASRYPRTTDSAGPDAVNILYVGRVSKEKNLQILCSAYGKLLEKGLNARLLVTGDGPYREEMELALAGTPAQFMGYVDGDDLADLYASCDILVFPSATDTFGNVVLEAQASGLPVVVSDQGGPHENMIEGETGFIARAGEVDELADAMERLARDRSLRERMGVAARNYAGGRSFGKAFEELWAMYLEDLREDRRTETEDPVLHAWSRTAQSLVS